MRGRGGREGGGKLGKKEEWKGIKIMRNEDDKEKAKGRKDEHKKNQTR